MKIEILKNIITLRRGVPVWSPYRAEVINSLEF